VGNKKGNIPWNRGKTRFTDPSVRKISDTLKKKIVDNFAEWRMKARISGVIPDTSKKLNKSTELAFLIGLILGDGNIYKFPRTECLRVTLGTDKPQLVACAIKVIEDIFGKIPSLAKRTNSNCYNVTFCQKDLGKRLEIPTGARGKMKIALPTWVWNNNRYLISILKGLFEAEASYCVHERSYTYNFEFSNRNTYLLNEVEKGLIVLGFHPERRIYAVRLRKKKEAVGFRDLIKFRTYPDI
jgi:hypothetical protein